MLLTVHTVIESWTLVALLGVVLCQVLTVLPLLSTDRLCSWPT